jgi:hypothetical protein
MEIKNNKRLSAGAGRQYPELWEKIVSYVVAVFIVLLVGFLVIRNEPFADPNLVVIIRIVLIVAVGVFGATIPGSVGFTWKGWGLAVRATATVGLVILTYLYNPYIVQNQTAVSEENIVVKITEVPKTGDGRDPKERISGIVMGTRHPQKYRIIVYAFSDGLWYVQPDANEPYTMIQPDGAWSTYTHLGSNYASLVVLPTFLPRNTSEALPGKADVISLTSVR